jgi:cytosine/creatinine deaminase
MTRLLLTNCRLPDGVSADVLLQDGLIAEIVAPGVLLVGGPAYDVAGRLLTPGLTDPHLHPDKAFRLASEAGSAMSVDEAIQAVRRGKPHQTAAAVYERSLRLLRWCLSFGTTRVRVHTEVDPMLGLRSVEGLLAARREMSDQMHVQVVAFPQEGIVREPGTLDLMRQALQMGCDVVGSITYQDPDAREHLSLAAGLAREFALPLDVHADFSVPVEESQLDAVLKTTRAHGLEGRVTLGHCTTLARMEPDIRDPLVARLVDADIRLVVLPRTDLYLDGAIAPLAELQEAGLSCFVASNNVCNAFTPVGRPSLPSVAALYALANREATKSQLDSLAQSLWQASEVCGVESRIEPGWAADLTVWGVEEAWQVVAEETVPDAVLFGGRIVYENAGCSIKESTPASV